MTFASARGRLHRPALRFRLQGRRLELAVNNSVHGGASDTVTRRELDARKAASFLCAVRYLVLSWERSSREDSEALW